MSEHTAQRHAECVERIASPSTRAEPVSTMRGIRGTCWRAPAVEGPVNTAIRAPSQNGATAPHRLVTAKAAQPRMRVPRTEFSENDE